MILKRNNKTIIFTVFFAITIFFIYSISSASELQVYDYDFEEVKLNTKKTATVSLATSSNSIKVTGIWLKNGTYFELSTDIPPEGLTVSSEAVGIKIAFTPTILGSVTDNLYIATEYSDPLNPYSAEVILSGTGISETDITINKILFFFDSSVASGSLIGNNGGSEANDHLLAYAQNKKQNANEGKSAENKLHTLRKMLDSAGKLIESEDLDGACKQLTSISKKCDGKDRPPDFVLGAAEPDPVTQLNNMIETLSESLDCE